MTLFIVLLTTLFAHTDYPVHILPDSPGYVYQNLNKNFDKEEDQNSPVIRAAIAAGNKNLNWLKHMNASRASDNQIALTRPGELTSYPISSPSVYNEKIIGDRHNDLINTMPQVMKDIIYGNAAFTNEPGLPMDEYIAWAKKVDRNYQSANRWSLMQPNLAYYSQNAYRDLRGFYFLTRDQNRTANFQRFQFLTIAEQNQYKMWLSNMCANSRVQNCASQLQTHISDGRIEMFYQKYLPASQALWDSFFNIVPYRRDIAWTSASPDVATVPVRNTTPEIEKFLVDNIEDEWKWNSWNLRLEFTPRAAIHVEFRPNVTPHVSNYDKIVMDENTPLTEWDVMWTIRHEFGHSLGFKDCYIEFYDSQAKAMVNYQLDITDMMCSRAGTMLETHYLEMKSAYLKD
jgi:hypothetical protein